MSFLTPKMPTPPPPPPPPPEPDIGKAKALVVCFFLFEGYGDRRVLNTIVAGALGDTTTPTTKTPTLLG